MKHKIQRVRHELRRRRLIVTKVGAVTPNMLRVHLSGDELQGFTSLAADDHVKLFLPVSGGVFERRDYTPRYHDKVPCELTLDFAMHQAGPATDWARNVVPGDTVEIGGPRGSVVVPYDFDWWLLVGDETSLPSIGRRMEELPLGTNVTTVIAVGSPEDEQVFATSALHNAIWLHRPLDHADDPSSFLKALSQFSPKQGDGFIWIAAEAKVARTVRMDVLERIGHPKQWLKASGYWVKGRADAQEKL